MLFYLIISALIIQRLTELAISKKNEKWLLTKGAIEYGSGHYKYIVLMHVLFFISMITEFILRGSHVELNIINYLFLVFLILLTMMRIWVLITLEKYWNTKIFRIPGSTLIRTGPYRYFRHPNYLIVTCEIFTIPVIFDLYYTAIIFSALNAALLSVRISVENKALKN